MEHLEGKISVLAALESRRRTFKEILVATTVPADRAKTVLDAAAAMKVPTRRPPAEEIDAVAHGKSHGGIVAICTPRPFADEAAVLALAARPDAFFLLLEGADDARNLGFTLRSAEAFGVTAALVRKREWDFDSVEVGRPSAGAFERMEIAVFENVALLEKLKKRGLKLYGCLANVTRTIYDTQLWKPCVIAVGGEKRGLSGATRGLCDSFMKIPTRTGSLSLSHAAAVALGEAMRQRLAQPLHGKSDHV